jgi:hypothetical protein
MKPFADEDEKTIEGTNTAPINVDKLKSERV